MKNDWQIKKLGEICKIKTGKKDVNQGNPSGKYPFFTCAREHTYSDEYSFDTEALLVAGNGDVGHVSYYKGKFEAYQRTYVLSDFKDVIPEYLFMFLSGYLKEKVSKQKLGNTMPYIKMGMLTGFEVPFPPISEQHKIVKDVGIAFEDLKKVKENSEDNLIKSKDLFESYLEKIFTGDKAFFELKSLGDIATFRNGINFTKGSKGELIKIVGVKDFQKSFWVPFQALESVTIDGKLNETDLLKDGDILAVRSNGNPQLIGRTLLAEGVKGKISHSGFTIRIRLNSNEVEPVYLCHYLKSQIVRSKLVKSGTGVNIKSLNQGALSSLMIPVPISLTEQKTIVKKLDQLSEQTKKLESIYQTKLSAIEELKKSVLSKVFSKGL